MKNNLGIFLSAGDSFKNMSTTGQDVRFKSLYIDFYAKHFKKIYVFSYAHEPNVDLPKNVYLISNTHNLNRFLYAILLPLLQAKYIKRCDVIRVFHLLGTTPAILSKVFFGKPFIFNYAYDYQDFALMDGKTLQFYLTKLLEPIALIFADKVFAANKQIFNKISSVKRIYIPNGVNTEVLKPFSYKKQRGVKILSIGRLEIQKNYENLIKSLKGLKVTLILIGKGSLKDKLKGLAKENGLKLAIIDKVDNSELPKIYNSVTLFALSSLIEGSPKALLEAMACGLPVLGSKVPGTEEIIDNEVNGILCGTDVKSIRKGMLKLLESERLRSDLGRNARKYIVQNHEISFLLLKEVKALNSIAGAQND